MFTGFFLVVPGMGLEPTRTKYTRPSTVPVYQFQHPGLFNSKLFKKTKPDYKSGLFCDLAITSLG